MDAFITALARIGALIRKELLALVKEPASRLILVGPALMQALLLTSMALWLSAFVVWTGRLAGIYLAPRADGQPG